MLHDPTALAFWQLFTRLGDSEILLPITIGLAVWLAIRSRAMPIVPWWFLMLGIAATITTISKIAFIGWGIGSARLDFTGFSGHSMFSAAIYPVLIGLALSGGSVTRQRIGWAAGGLLALAIGFSRLEVDAHSVSEVVAGLLLGGAASALALWIARPRPAPLPLWLPAVVVAWFAWMPGHAPPSITHNVVTQVALKLSGREVPYTRGDLQQRLRAEKVVYLQVTRPD
jgi:membrane-associated phospholipid phosphatase